MSSRPAYVVHDVAEDDVTVDWFYGHGRVATKVVQLVLVVVSWFFALLPLVVTGSALAHRDDPGAGWWWYPEGFEMWDTTMAFLGVLTILFVVGFLVLHLLDRRSAVDRDRRRTYDEERLAERLAVAGDWYAGKFGPEALRLESTTIRIEPYGDIETYELRGLYRTYGID